MKPTIPASCLFVVLFWNSAVTAVPYRFVDLYPLNLPDGYTDLSSFPATSVFSSNSVAPGQVVGTMERTAFLWNAPMGDYTFLPAAWVQPPNVYPYRFVRGTDGVHQVGHAVFDFNSQHAVLWNGPAGPAIDLHPAAFGFLQSYAICVSGSQQVGLGEFQYSPNITHAVLWNGTAQSAVDLHPTFAHTSVSHSTAVATDGTQQVGYFRATTHDSAHAVLWEGTAASAVDLSPPSGSDSRALGVGGGQQVGFLDNQATLWSGSAASAVNLHPTLLSGFDSSRAYGTNGVNQVGFGTDVSRFAHALMWSGTADSAIDLHSLLPSQFRHSYAHTIDSQGVVYGLALPHDFSRYHAVMWVPVPEPSALMLVTLAVSAVVASRRIRIG